MVRPEVSDMGLRIVADENIPYIEEAFSGMGSVRLLSGRAMTAEAVKGADILLVRSVTKVDEKLLAGSQVKYVGTATIGTDHVDCGWLAKNGIGFAAAPGSNANSVAEYMTAALLVLARDGNFQLQGKTIGVVGVGNVGSLVVAKAKALGMKVLMNDPPRAEDKNDPDRGKFITLDEMLKAEVDVITLHVPLEKGGKYPTWHLANQDFFGRLKTGAIFFNTCRGGVHETGALHRAIDAGRLGGVVLDTWEGEPRIDVGLLEKVEIGTPHIAGYSFDGKVEGTRMIYRAACKHFGKTPTWEAKLPAAPRAHLVIEANPLTCPAGRGTSSPSRERGIEDVLREAVLTVYDIEGDDARMRGLIGLGAEEAGKGFDRLRKEYPVRREFYNTEVELRGGDVRTAETLRGLGFKVRK